MKPGYLTTEFWLVAALFVLVVLNTPLGLGLSSQELITMAIGVAGYTGGRGLAKVQGSSTTIVGPQDTAHVDRGESMTTVTEGHHTKPPLPPGYRE